MAGLEYAGRVLVMDHLLSQIADMQDQMTIWRRDFHANPELGFDCVRTSETIAKLLYEFDVDEIHRGIGRTGVVAMIHGSSGSSGTCIGLRADMDALPMCEQMERPHRSTIDGRMHACGHDGHTAMLLGAARYLSATRRFSGSVALIFQPAEEGGGGAQAMVDEGIFDRFGITEVHAVHNLPGLPAGSFGTRPGPIMASADRLEIVVRGRGGHAAFPHLCDDPLLAASAIVQSAQSVVSRDIDPLASAVVSVTRFNAGTADNVISPSAALTVDVRALDPAVRDLIPASLERLASATAAAHGCSVEIVQHREYAVTVNDRVQTARAVRAAEHVAKSGGGSVDGDHPVLMGAEDFSAMLRKRPGCLMFIGNGDGPNLHDPAYDFNDGILLHGAAYFASLVELAN